MVSAWNIFKDLVSNTSMTKQLVFALLILVVNGQSQSFSGTWSGALTGNGFWGGLELALDRQGEDWLAQARLQIDGRLHSEAVSGISIRDRKLELQTMWEGREIRLNGTLEGDRIRGMLTLALGSQPERLSSASLDLVRLQVPSLVAGLVLPGPTGPYATGRTTFHWVDEDRDEALTLNKSDKRELLVHLWYPTEQGGSRSPYLPDIDSAIDHLPKGTAETASRLELTTQLNAPILRRKRLPVVVFSPGKGVKALLYSALQQDLASHGFVVAAIEHPFDAPIVVFPNGRAVLPLPKEARPPQPASDVVAQHEAADYRARDILFVKRALTRLNADPAGTFRNSLDLSKLSVAGHSLGGMAAFRACQLDTAILSCINIDGGYRARPYPATVDASKIQPPLLWLRRPLYVFSDAQLKQVGLSRSEFDDEVSMGSRVMDNVARGSFDVRLPHAGIDHMDFSDVRLLQKDISPTTRAARFLTIEMMRDWVRGFLTASEAGQPQRLLTQSSSAYREAMVSAYD